MTQTKQKVEYTYHRKVDSNVLSDVYYNLNDRSLYVAFHNGRYAAYQDVPPHEVDSMVAAPSVGRYYNSRVRGRYVGKSVSNPEFVARSLFSTPATAVKNTSPYVVRGEVKQTVESNYAATDLNDAIRQFLAENPGATVSEVTVKF